MRPPTVVIAVVAAWVLLPAGANERAVEFGNACAPGRRITIAAVGDLLFQPEIEPQAQEPGGYRMLWSPVGDVLAKADVTYGNLEGPVVDAPTVGARERSSNTALSFNYRPSLIDDLKVAGFTVVSTANNHALDRGGLGIDRTIENLEQRGLAFTGTRKRGETNRPWSAITRAGGLNIAWLACTYGTNGIPDLRHQVLYCFRQQAEVLAEIGRLSSDPSVDAVIFTPHWGIENSRVVEQRQRDLARAAIEAGAAAVIGAHPHVLQRWEKTMTRDGREGLVIYSTGNFISSQRKSEQRTGIIVLLELVKEAHAARARLSAAGYVLTWIDISGVPRVTENLRAAPVEPLPPANRMSIADLPHLPRSCGNSASAARHDAPAR